MRQQELKSAAGVAGILTIRKFKDGDEVWCSEPIPNKVVSSAGGYGRNIIARQLTGDTTHPLVIDSASLGDDNTTPIDSDTGLGNSLVAGVPLTNVVLTNNVIQIDVFVADANLADDTYEEMGFFCNGRLFSRIIINPAYTKATGEDTLFTYTISLTG
jgi:hypothetical protein